jgi:hypothetical protein
VAGFGLPDDRSPNQRRPGRFLCSKTRGCRKFVSGGHRGKREKALGRGLQGLQEKNPCRGATGVAWVAWVACDPHCNLPTAAPASFLLSPPGSEIRVPRSGLRPVPARFLGPFANFFRSGKGKPWVFGIGLIWALKFDRNSWQPPETRLLQDPGRRTARRVLLQGSGRNNPQDSRLPPGDWV